MTQETTEQFGFDDLSATWETGVELRVFRGDAEFGVFPINRPQVSLGGVGSDQILNPGLLPQLWKFLYRGGQLFFVGSDRGQPGYLNQQKQPVVYCELRDRDEIQLGEYRVVVAGLSNARAFLEGITAPHLGARWTLIHSEIRLGRGQSQVKLEDNSVSRDHARILQKDGDFWLQADSHRSETRLNGAVLATGQLQRLQDGDLIHLGRQVLRFGVARNLSLGGLRLFTLGRFEVWLGDSLIETASWQGPQVQYFLAYLCAFRGQPISEERLMSQLWMGEDVTKKRLHNVISIVRNRLRPLSPEPILREPAGLRLHPDLPLWHDLQALREVLRSDTDEVGAGERIKELYQGPFLPACQQAWAGALRSELETATVDWLSRAAQRSLERSDPQNAETLSQLAIQIDPLAQEAYRVLLEALWVQAKTREMLRYYQLLSEQLGRARLSLDPQISAIYGRLG